MPTGPTYPAVSSPLISRVHEPFSPILAHDPRCMSGDTFRNEGTSKLKENQGTPRTISDLEAHGYLLVQSTIQSPSLF